MTNEFLTEEFSHYVLDQLAKRIDPSFTVDISCGTWCDSKNDVYHLIVLPSFNIGHPLSYSQDYINITLTKISNRNEFEKHKWRAFLKKCLNISQHGHNIFLGSEGIAPGTYFCKITFMHSYETIEKFKISYELRLDDKE